MGAHYEVVTLPVHLGQRQKIKISIHYFSKWTSCTYTEDIGGNGMISAKLGSLSGLVQGM